MDIPRPDLVRKRRRKRILFGIAALVILGGVTVGLSRLEPALPSVDKSAVWTGQVERGEMLRQVRGTGILAPEQILYVLSDTDGRIERIMADYNRALAQLALREGTTLERNRIDLESLED